MRQLVTQASFTAEPLAELKTWLAISGTRDDAVLLDLLAAATLVCESFTGLVPLKSTVTETLPATGEWQALHTRPFVGPGIAEGIAADGTRRMLDPADYAVELCSDGGRFRLTASIPVPQVAVTFDLGLAEDWAALDSGLRHGIVRCAAHQYRERDRGGDTALPAAVAALWRPWRRLRL
ncbi:hypothetical protein K3172_01085 [Qipengyuania sp. 6B39]|uniref:head-tail connector protein n=1 Tax=Qipengyuania proteolytica TaxID=2867239 RepID=UPI001C8978CE|nr:hypothetical protein [Qipengyuania proteolytica]MBX7494444.1 hypothetical protein [Qipengyuania proteolytica]